MVRSPSQLYALQYPGLKSIMPLYIEVPFSFIISIYRLPFITQSSPQGGCIPKAKRNVRLRPVVHIVQQPVEQVGRLDVAKQAGYEGRSSPPRQHTASVDIGVIQPAWLTVTNGPRNDLIISESQHILQQWIPQIDSALCTKKFALWFELFRKINHHPVMPPSPH